jgi:hypothetical protein
MGAGTKVVPTAAEPLSGDSSHRSGSGIQDPGSTHLQCLGPGALVSIHDRTVGLAIWDRCPRLPTGYELAAMVPPSPAGLVTSGTPPEAARALKAQLSRRAGALIADIGALAQLFAVVAGVRTVRLRLEHVDDDACRRFHVDAVRMRLLCTYAGPGTQWQDAHGRLHRMARLQVGLFKGSRHPSGGAGILHRSPPVSHLPPARRARLLLCIDETGTFE